MSILKFNLENKGGKFKCLNATNGGPRHKRHADDQNLSNFKDYKAARIPYARNHDSASHDTYGGPYSHDISCIFRDFDADANDPASYDFACTDEAILICLDAGTETYFRLGQTIEHHIKKHFTLPPKDFKKWAVICEHIIRHYNEGWADGYHFNIQYWEIWNEPDLDCDSTNKRTWGGTKEQFFDLYEITSKHLKSCFPNVKIGGPALAGYEDWGRDFIAEMSKRKAPLDFFSWHIYTKYPIAVTDRAERLKKMLMDNGYENTESILNEWNYVRGWSGNDFIYSVKSIIGIKGAAFMMAVMSLSQRSSIDMLMYYDTRPSIFNGAFDYYTCEKLKGYYPLYWYGMFYDMEYEVRSENDIDDIYSLCGCDSQGKVLSVITYYSEDDNAPEKSFKLDFGKDTEFEIYLLDDKHNGELVSTTKDLNVTMAANTCIMVKEK